MQDLNEQHELDVHAAAAAADVYGGDRAADRDLAYEIASFEWGLSFDGGEARVTCWLIDESYVYVLSTVDGEDSLHHAVEVVSR